VIGVLVAVAPAAATAASLTKISTDPYTNSSSQHATEVEPDTFASGSTIVAAFQAGRFFSGGGSSNIGWATSTNGGTSWTSGFLSGLTTFASGTYARVSDPSVAYDAKHNVWLIASLPISGSTCCGAAVVVNRSSDGTTWSGPATVADTTIPGAGSNLDKDWVVCDNVPSSPFYGNCYVEWDDFGNADVIKLSTSSDGGLTWGPPRQTANAATGLGGQPVVKPSGTVVVPISNSNFTAILAFRSTDGGASWSNTQKVASITAHTEAGKLRSQVFPSAEIDGGGKVYLVWQDCRFRRQCKANDIVMKTSRDGITWSAIVRVPIDSTDSSVDHFLPGLGVDRKSAGSTARLALTYYYYPSTRCSTSTCRLDVGFISSSDGGQHWAPPIRLAGPVTNTWLAKTDIGYMVGDYISTSFGSNGTAHPVFAIARAPTGTTLHEAMYTPSTGVSPTTTVQATAPGRSPVLSRASGHPAPRQAAARR
jgi:hypothetical protein